MQNVCVVTGGVGFIGCALSSSLVRRFDKVLAVDILHPQIHPNRTRPRALHPEVELVIGDVTDKESWENLLSKIEPDTIVHLAAETGTGQSLTEASRHANVNVVGTARMIDALSARGLPSHIILTSSRAVYGEGAWLDTITNKSTYPGQRSKEQLERKEWDFNNKVSLPFDATKTRPTPSSVYGATKLAQENILQSWCQSFGVDLSILRLQNVYGPGQSLFNSYTGIVTLFSNLARQGKQIPVYEDGRITRDFVFIDDVVSAIEMTMQGKKSSVIAYDIGSGQATTILDLARRIAAHYKAPEPHITGQYRNGDVRHASCDISRSISDLDWSPKWDLDSGLLRLFKWIEESEDRHVA
jgi:dTDP-L-rhamnose 4-epimerase